MSTNPYAAPKAAVADEPVPQGEYVPGGKSVPASNGWNWIADGWTLFKAAPGLWIGMIVVFLLIVFAMALIPFVGSIAMSLLMPVLIAGLMLGCQAIERGQGLEFNHLFAGFRDRLGTLVAVGALSLAATVALVLIVTVVMGAGVFTLIAGGESGEAARGMAMGLTVLLTMLIVFALSIPIAMALWFAPALVVLNDLGAVEAMKASFSGCLRNVVPFLVYGIVAMALLFVAMLPLFLGLLVAGPVLLASVYTGYRDIYLR